MDYGKPTDIILAAEIERQFMSKERFNLTRHIRETIRAEIKEMTLEEFQRIKSEA